MRKLLRAFFVCVTLLGAIVAISSPSKASSGAWVVVCGYTGSRADDPIVKPNAPGTSHLHDFFGNTSVTASSTFQSMQAASSTCPAGDLAGYWAPSLLRNGTKVNPAGGDTRQQTYYTADNLASGTRVEPFPPDMRIVAGNAMATSAGDNPTLGEEIYWGCSDNSVPGKPVTPPSSCRTGILSLHIGFPNCWDGVLTHSNDTPHLRYPAGGGTCPAGFSHALPRVIMRLEYPVGTSSGAITLSSGPSFTAHADFWNTWDQAKLTSLVNNCLNADKDCGVFRGTTDGISSGGSVDGGTGAAATSTSAVTRRTRHRHTTTTHEAARSAAVARADTPTTAPSTTNASNASTAAAAEEAAAGTSAAAFQEEVATAAQHPTGIGRGSLPLTGAPMGAALAVAFGLLGLGATTLHKTRTPRPRPKH
jgi:Domain of unknown function (DUF1996)